MRDETGYGGKTVLVAGAGRSGLAAAEFLIGRGARVILSDAKAAEQLDAAARGLAESSGGMLRLECGAHRADSFARCDLVVASPGVPLSLPEFERSRRAGIPVIAEVELAFRHLRGRIVAITGSNGKTTTTALVAHLLQNAGMRAWAAGNIGLALTGLVSRSTPEDVHVVELSSFQLEGIAGFRPWIGSILNITPDHLDRYGSFEDYAAAKRRIFRNQGPDDYAVLNADDARTAAMADQLAAATVLFSRSRPVGHGVFLRGGRVIFRGGGRETALFSSGAIGLPGAHNLENVLAAAAMAILAGAPPESLEEGVGRFEGLEHRIEFVAEIDGVRYYNDSKATNVDAAIKSLEAFPGGIVLIAGGRDKGGDFSLLRDAVRRRVKHLVAIGEAAGAIRRALGREVGITGASSMPEAVALSRQYAGPGDTVLLAPACASFDMFADYEHRGRAFKDAVRGAGLPEPLR